MYISFRSKVKVMHTSFQNQSYNEHLTNWICDRLIQQLSAGLEIKTWPKLQNLTNHNIKQATKETLSQCTRTQEKLDKAHIFTVASAEAVARHWSMGENWTHQIPPVWPKHTPMSDRSAAFHTCHINTPYRSVTARPVNRRGGRENFSLGPQHLGVPSSPKK